MYRAMGHALGADLMERYEFDCEGDRLVGNLHLPQGDAHGVAILTGPLTSVKEQATGAWASALAERGFVALSFDHRYYGESAGSPRQLENPAAKIADIQAAAASLHSHRRFASTPMFAVAINSAAPAIARAHEAEKRWRETGVEETVPAVAADNGDVAMPLAEAFAYYGTPRGAVPNYINGFAVQSWAYTSTFDAIGAAKLITVPTIVIHSERALAPSLARRFQADLNNARVLWVESSGQIDFYDDPGLIAIGADAVARFFTAAARQ